MGKMRIAIALMCVATALLAQSGFQPVMGKARHAVSNNARPAKGTISIDGAFRTTVRRITDRTFDRYAAPGVTNEYSRHDPVNANGTRLILLETSTGDWLLYNNAAPFGKIKKIAGLGGDIEPRWDPVKPYLFYAFRDAALVSYDIRSNKITVIRDFRNVAAGVEIAGTGSEGEPSENFRYWTILLKNSEGVPRAVVLFDLLTRSIISTKTTFEYNLQQTEINWVSTTPLTGDPILGWNFRPERDPFGSQHRGAIRYDKAWNKKIDTLVDGHADTAVGLNNEELMVYQNNANDFVEMVNLSNGVRTPLFKIPFPFSAGSTLNLHFSGNIRSTSLRKGWALVVADEPDARNNSWISNQMVMVELKRNPRIWRIGFNHNNYNEDYYTESFATITRDGRHVVFQSNWGNSGLNTEVYRVELPPSWETLFP